jgi:HEPN domain-containing protein
LRYEDYPQAVFYAQQSVEKSVKAMLEAKRHVIYNNGPELISMFVDVLKMSGRMNLRTF